MAVSLCLSLLLLSVQTWALFEEDVTLSVPFTSGSGLTPGVARGEKEAQPLHSSLRTVLEPEMRATRANLWLVSGATNQAVAYESTGNLNPTEWTISFWVMGQEWNLRREASDTLWLLEGKDCSVRLERVAGAQLQLTLEMPKKKSTVLRGAIGLDMEKPRQIAVACGADAARLFLDGREIG